MSNKYTIEVYYSTGNSFGSGEETQCINLAWNNIDLAKQCLKHIKEHYDLYCEMDKYSFKKGRTDSEILEDALSKEWCQKKPLDKYTIELSALCDDGQWRTVCTDMWCGYFETLHSAEIVCKSDADMKITF